MRTSVITTIHETGPVQAVSLLCGINDFVLLGSSASTAFSSITSWVSTIKAAGYTNVYVATLTSSTPAAAETYRESLNTLIINGAAGNGYTVIPFGADANMGCHNCYMNTTFFSDGRHPTTLGQQTLGAIVKTTLDGLGFN